ncbi:MAG: response regulator transcription factor [Flavobacterium sp.]|nr:response regulator transcription factor [Flavobacterium sp.]
MIKCIIVDDEPSAVDILKIYVEKIPYLSLQLATTDAIEALTFIQTNQTDLVFLDINMPDISGLDFAKLTQNKAKIIFTTAYSEFALDSYKYNAVDYLMKPVSFDNFLRASQKLLNNNNTPQNKEPVPDEKEPVEDYFYVKTERKGKISKVMFKDILYVESLKNYVAIHTIDKEQIISLLTMKEMDERLPFNDFFRCHKSFMVALDKIKAVDGNEIIFQELKDKVPIGATYRDSFFLMLNPKILSSR